MNEKKQDKIIELLKPLTDKERAEVIQKLNADIFIARNAPDCLAEARGTE